MKILRISVSLSALLFLFVALLPAQNRYQNGYVIKQPGDTLFGEIRLAGDKSLSQLCNYRSPEGEMHEFRPFEIYGYRIDDRKYLVSRRVDSVDVFLEYLVDGPVSLYYLNDDAGPHYYLGQEGMPIKELIYTREIVSVGGRQMLKESRDFLITFGEYMPASSIAVSDKLASVKSLSRSGLAKIVKQYNAESCPGEVCTVFDSKPNVQISVEAVGGYAFFNKDVFSARLSGYNKPQGGALINLWLPQNGSNIYLRTGVIVASFDEIVSGKKSVKVETEDFLIVKCPIQAEWIFSPLSTVQPKVGIGFNVYIPVKTSFYIGVSLMAGMNINLTSKTFLSLTYDLDFDSGNVLLPEKIMSHSANAGIGYRF